MDLFCGVRSCRPYHPSFQTLRGMRQGYAEAKRIIYAICVDGIQRNSRSRMMNPVVVSAGAFLFAHGIFVERH